MEAVGLGVFRVWGSGLCEGTHRSVKRWSLRFAMRSRAASCLNWSCAVAALVEAEVAAVCSAS